MSTAHLKSAAFYIGDDEYFEERKLKSRFFSEGNFISSNNSYSTQDSVPPKPSAVVIRNASKFYKKSVPVLDKLDMTVTQGTIYSLLGSSGCGKTTLLNCIVGIGKFTSGDMWLFGKRGRDCGIPGKSVGYMPQDISLYKDFSINETFVYFGMLNGMDVWEIMKAIIFYSNLLKLPQPKARVSTLSGGQKRRVSFAISLMHNPELLILDEPTVGVDPLLRESIWKYLVNLTKSQNTTVIITTHYIDEARNSNKVGIMRNGRLLAESSPKTLLRDFNTTSLESVVLQLCRENEITQRYVQFLPPLFEQNKDIFNKKSVSDHVAGVEQQSSSSKTILPAMSLIEPKKSTAADSRRRIAALVKKNTFLMLRNFPMLLVIIFVPTCGILATFIADGNDPSNVNFGVVNAELNDSITCDQASSVWNGTCDVDFMSCKFMKHLTSPSFNVVNYSTTEEAEKAVRRGEIWGFISFPKDYSWEFYQRGVAGIDVDVLDFNKSDIIIRMDESSTIVSRTLKYALYKVFQKYLKDLLQDCGLDPKKAEYPLQYKEPIFGFEDISFRDFIIPSNYVGYMFFYPIITAGIRYVNEKREGTLERSLVAGVNMWEIFFAYSICEFFLAIPRTVIIYGMAVWLFEMTIVGSLGLQFLLGMIATYMGVAGGFFLGAFCTEEIQVALLAMAIFFPNSVVSGMVWPLEGMPAVLQSIAYFFPCTLACESMRSMACRGWELMHPNVWPGFASSIAYTVVLFGAAIVISSRRFIK